MSTRPGGTVDVGSVAAGAETARVRSDQVSAAVRAQRQRDTWRYLNRRYPPDEAAELADILGLTPDARKPGHCACGAVLPMPSVYAGGDVGYRPGSCRACVTGRTTSPDRAQPAPVLCNMPRSVLTGRCGYCHREYRLDGQGHLRPHPAWTRLRGVERRLSMDCCGSGKRPGDTDG